MSAHEIATPITERVLAKLQKSLAEENMNDLPAEVRYKVKDYVLNAVYQKVSGWVKGNQVEAER